MRFPHLALLVLLPLLVACAEPAEPADPLFPELDLPVIGTVGMHARDLPGSRVVLNLFADGRSTVDGRPIEIDGLAAVLTPAADLDRDREHPEQISRTNLILRVERAVEWDRVRWVIRTACDPEVRMRRHFLAVVHEGDRKEGTFQLLLPLSSRGHDQFARPRGDYLRIATRFTRSAPPEAIASALGEPARAVLVDPHPGAPADYVIRLLDVLVRTGPREICIDWGSADRGAGPFGMRLNGEPVPSASPALPPVPRSPGIVGLEIFSDFMSGRFSDGRATDKLVVRILSSGGSREHIAAARRQLTVWADRQHENGFWEVPGASRIRATAVVVLGFLRAGRTHRVGEYRKVVRAGLRFLKQSQGRDGRFSEDPADHAAATWAMAKSYAMTQSPLFKQSAAQGLAALEKGSGPFAVLARSAAAKGGLVEADPTSDPAAALAEVLAGPIPETDSRALLAMARKWWSPEKVK